MKLKALWLATISVLSHAPGTGCASKLAPSRALGWLLKHPCHMEVIRSRGSKGMSARCLLFSKWKKLSKKLGHTPKHKLNHFTRLMDGIFITDLPSSRVTHLSVNPTTSRGLGMESSWLTCPNQDTLPAAEEGAQLAFEHVALRGG